MGEEKKAAKREVSLSSIFTVIVSLIVGVTIFLVIVLFAKIYEDAMEENAVTSSNRAVTQVNHMLSEYMEDTKTLMGKINQAVAYDEEEQNDFIQSLVEVRGDVVAVTTYDEEGNLRKWWSDGHKLKDRIYQNLSYFSAGNGEGVFLSNPHVETLFEGYYPWVVTLYQNMKNTRGEDITVCVDIRFSNISNYVDDVGIGEHGYCYIEDAEHNIVYHPQQQLIYSGLKEEEVKKPGKTSDVIYTAKSLHNSDWRVVGVCYVKEMVTDKVYYMMEILVIVLIAVMVAALISGIAISRLFIRPAKKLAGAMRSFEKNAKDFSFEQVEGTSEIMELGRSFEHMSIRVQKLMEKVRQEEISLRKTELKALQAQINPHFLYNTLDAIAWLCEDGRNKDAEEMVNALARLFRISISKGHEMITIEKELQHAQSYLRIQKYRYKDQFVYVEDVDKDCLQFLCNKITLQPFIENAIYHGLNRMVDEGEIRIGIHQDDNDIIMTVSDNGMGMTKEKCESILKHESDEKNGIGIKNVDERIKIYFGEQYGVTIDSELDEGTTVTIRMPKILVEGEVYEK